MYLESVKLMAAGAKSKVAFLERSKSAYLIAAALAGTYVGLGIILIFTIGAPLAGTGLTKIVMGVSFGIALTLVVFAGSELFTGNNMIMTLGLLRKEVKPIGLLKIWVFSWTGNLIGSMVLAYIVMASGALNQAAEFVQAVSAKKMNMPITELFLRGILCNWLVCLALWTASRAKGDGAKCILIFWCLFAFIACGFEHSVANMTLLSTALFMDHGADVSWLGFGYNLLWVSLGNIIGGGFFVGFLYWFSTRKEVE
ncbi:MAG: formate/nitrite transporter family protein [Phycisphaerae bacterium]|jgi:nitrite transporter NirC|nr:formate/nitrite transporter family protein [Phycisphaerae bacterium]